MDQEFTFTGTYSPTKTEVIILPTNLLSKFNFNRHYRVFTHRIKHASGTVLHEPILGTNKQPNWEAPIAFMDGFPVTLNQLNRLGKLIFEETCPKSDLSAEAAFRATTSYVFNPNWQGTKIGIDPDCGWVFRINNQEQDVPVLTNSIGDIFLSPYYEEFKPSVKTLKAEAIKATIPPGEYTVFSPMLNFEEENWFTFKTDVPLNVRIHVWDGWLAGLSLSKD